MRMLVTGAAGFIGFHTARMLLDRGDEVVGIDNLNSYYDPGLKAARLEILEQQPNFRFIKMDISDRAAIEAAFEREKFQRVVHLAAQAGVRHSIEHPHVYVDSNIAGFLHIIEGCRRTGVEHLVYASTSSVYGANTKMPFSVDQGVGHPYVDDIVRGVVAAVDRIAKPNPAWDSANPDPSTSFAPFRIYNIGNEHLGKLCTGSHG